jgi:hypothetical protein
MEPKEAVDSILVCLFFDTEDVPNQFHHHCVVSFLCWMVHYIRLTLVITLLGQDGICLRFLSEASVSSFNHTNVFLKGEEMDLLSESYGLLCWSA